MPQDLRRAGRAEAAPDKRQKALGVEAMPHCCLSSWCGAGMRLNHCAASRRAVASLQLGKWQQGMRGRGQMFLWIRSGCVVERGIWGSCEFLGDTCPPQCPAAAYPVSVGPVQD